MAIKLNNTEITSVKLNGNSVTSYTLNSAKVYPSDSLIAPVVSFVVISSRDNDDGYTTYYLKLSIKNNNSHSVSCTYSTLAEYSYSASSGTITIAANSTSTTSQIRWDDTDRRLVGEAYFIYNNVQSATVTTEF